MTKHKHNSNPYASHEHHLDAQTKQAVYKTLAAHMATKGYDIALTPTPLGFDLTLMRWSNDGSNNELASDTRVIPVRDITEGIRILQAVQFASR